jgi:hypothetical protein
VESGSGGLRDPLALTSRLLMNSIPRPGSLLGIAVHFLAAVTLHGSAIGQASTAPVRIPKDPYRAIVERNENAPVEDGHPVVVVDAAGKPVRGASVVVVDTKAIGRTRRRAVARAAVKRFPGDAETSQLALFALHGKRYVTDESGETRFARISRGTVVAIRGRTIAVASIFLRSGRDPRVIRLVLRPRPGVDVVVLDHRGRPVQGVEVRLVWRSEHGASWGRDGTSGAGGRVRLPPLTESRASGMVPHIEARIASTRRVAVKLDPKTFVNDPEKPVQLKLPPLGMVRVYILDDEKRPVKKGVEAVFLQSTSASGDREVFTAPELKGDSATFPAVEVGMKFEVWCQFEGSRRPQRVRSDGPRHPMDMRVVTLAGITAQRTIRFRVLDQKGEAVASEEIGVILAVPDHFRVSTQKTAPDGRCKIVLPDPFVDCKDGYLTITRRGGGRRLVYRGAARISLEKLQNIETPLELRLVDEKLLVSGRVVDASGKPVRGVHVSTPNHYRAQNRGSSSMSGDAKFHRHSMETGKDGRFEFRELDADPAGVTIALDRWFRHRKGFYIISGKDAEPGAEDHEVVVGFTSKLIGSLQGVPKDLSFPGQIDVRDKDGGRLEGLWVNLDRGGGFTMNQCPPGEYQVAIKLRGVQEPFLTVKNVKVEAGKPCRDPRLQGIDLAKYGRFIKITLLRPDKTPAPAATVWSVRMKAGKFRGGSGKTTNANGVIRLCVPLEGANLSIIPRDGLFRPQSFANQKEDLTVTLRPGWRTKIAFKNMPKLPDSLRYGVRLQVPRRPGDGWETAFSSNRQSSLLVENGHIELWSGVPGMHRLTIYPQFGVRGRGSNRRANSLRFDVEVKEDGKGVQVFDLELDESSLEMIQEHIDAAKENEKSK